MRIEKGQACERRRLSFNAGVASSSSRILTLLVLKCVATSAVVTSIATRALTVLLEEESDMVLYLASGWLLAMFGERFEIVSSTSSRSKDSSGGHVSNIGGRLNRLTKCEKDLGPVPHKVQRDSAENDCCPLSLGDLGSESTIQKGGFRRQWPTLGESSKIARRVLARFGP